MTRSFRILLASATAAVSISASAAAHPSWSLTRDADGNLYFSDLERVWRVTPDGAETVVVERVHTHQIGVGGDHGTDADAVYGEHQDYDERTDTFSRRYWRAALGGATRTPEWVEYLDAAPAIFVSDADGAHYRLRNDREGTAVVERFTRDGEMTLVAGGRAGHADGKGAEARFRLFGDAAMGPDGAIYLTSGGFVRRTTPDGTVTTLVDESDGFPASLQPNGDLRYSALLGIAVSADGDIYFCDLDQRKVFVRSPDDEIAAAFESDDGFYPTGVAVFDGVLHVLEAPRDLEGLGPNGSSRWRVWRRGGDGGFVRVDRDGG